MHFFLIWNHFFKKIFLAKNCVIHKVRPLEPPSMFFMQQTSSRKLTHSPFCVSWNFTDQFTPFFRKRVVFSPPTSPTQKHVYKTKIWIAHLLRERPTWRRLTNRQSYKTLRNATKQLISLYYCVFTGFLAYGRGRGALSISPYPRYQINLMSYREPVCQSVLLVLIYNLIYIIIDLS